ncbi:hypothetical protein HID58_066799 [Brassica napus]|uniref:Guanine nucleotide-binding protein subunit beta-like protein n=1 Tax=Brassica napus TaxID=3708 RepID=A0ABQ7ZGM3_BRANA|nr:hypothetical protein HID58_066799 [Brassica napus]
MCAHTDMVTAIATPVDNSDMIVTSSRDKSIILWKLNKDEKSYGVAQRRLTAGTVSFVSGILPPERPRVVSWDTRKTFSLLPFSTDNRQIVSASRDGAIKLWNTLGECNPNTLVPTIVSASWDHTVKVWNLANCKLRNTLAGHSGYLNTVAVSPDGSLCASGGKDGGILLWDLAEGKKLYCLEAGSIIHSLCFSPNRYWLCAATENSIRIWDLESKSVVEDLKVDLKAESDVSAGTGNKTKVIYCTSLNWSADGNTLFSGYTDGVIRVWGIGRY